ncbi:MAG TPA: hypothetical protein VF172_02740 [Nitrososphaera sp.]|jgi:hypothetical protein
MTTPSSLYAVAKVLDIVIVSLLMIFLIGVLAFEMTYFGFEGAIIQLPHEAEPYFDFLPWVIFVLLAADIYVKYRKLDNDWKALVRIHWLDIVLAILIPVFMPLKFMKLVKALKTAKSGGKIVHKIKSMRK